MDTYAAGNGFATITVGGKVADSLAKYAFALEIDGDSMLEELRPGDTVVAKLDRDDAATLKKYRERGVDAENRPIVEFKPLNEDYAPIMMDADNPGQITGPVLEHLRRLR